MNKTYVWLDRLPLIIWIAYGLAVIGVWMTYGWSVYLVFYAIVMLYLSYIFSCVHEQDMEDDKSRTREGWRLDNYNFIGLVRTYRIKMTSLNRQKKSLLNERKKLMEKLQKANERPEFKREVCDVLYGVNVGLNYKTEVKAKYLSFEDLSQFIVERGQDRYLKYTNDKLDDMLRLNPHKREEVFSELAEYIELPQGESESELVIDLLIDSSHMDESGIDGVVDKIFNLPEIKEVITQLRGGNKPLGIKEIKWA